MDDSNFFSLNRFVELGVEMGVANQMASVVNESMRSMHIPEAQNATSKIYYVAIEGKAVGPLNEGELMQLITQKKVNKNTLVWMPGMSGWKVIENVPEVLKVVALTSSVFLCHLETF